MRADESLFAFLCHVGVHLGSGVRGRVGRDNAVRGENPVELAEDLDLCREDLGN